MSIQKTSILFTFFLLCMLSCKEKEGKTTNTKEETSIKQDTRLGGLALYTVRDAMAEDAKATLKTVANIGYATIEAAGYKDGSYYNMSPADFKNYLAT